MSSSRLQRKKLILSLLLIAVVLAGVFGMGHGVGVAHAALNVVPDPPAAQPQAGNAMGGMEAIFGSTSWFYGLVLAFLILVRSLFAVLLTLAGNLLNILFQANMELVPSTEAVVQVGWIILRDLVNGVFIMLVLWIALTIILGIEQFGGKKLLAKVLAVAILINFSLAIVTGIFVLSNQFAKAFYDKIAVGAKNAKGDVDIASYIVNVTRLQTIAANTLNKEQAARLAAAQAEGARIRAGTGPITFGDRFRDGMLASTGFHSANAKVDTMQNCNSLPKPEDQQACQKANNDLFTCVPSNPNFNQATCDAAVATLTRFFERPGFLDAISRVATGVNYVADFFKGIADETGDWSKVTFTQALNAVIGIILLGIAVTTFLYAAVALAMRYFAVIFLAIASPIAFLTIALPLGYGKSEGWDHWWKEFMKWVFFAPAFYFLIYLTLIMAYNYKTAFQSEQGVSITSNPKYILAMVIVMGTLMYASRLAKKTSGKAGEFTVGLAKKAGGLALGVTAGVATGGTLMAMRGLRRGLAKPGGRVERTANALASSKLARIATFGASKLPQRALLGGYQADKQDIDERKKQFENLSQDQLFAMHKGSLSAKDRTAMLSVAAGKSGWINALEKDQPGAFGTGVKTAKRYGMAQDLMKADPTVATEDLLTSSDKEKVKAADGKNEELTTDPAHPSKAYADNAVRQVSENLTGKQIDDMNTDALDNDDVLDGLIRNNNLTTTRLRDVVHKNFEKGQKLIAAMPEALKQIERDIASLDAAARAATAAGNTAKAAELNTQKSTLNAQANRLSDIRRYITTTPGGTGLGVTPEGWEPTPTPPSFSGNRVINGRIGTSLAVDLTRNVAGGHGPYAFTAAPGSGFIVGPDGILKTDPTMSLMPGTHPVAVTVTDAAGATANIDLTVVLNRP